MPPVAGASSRQPRGRWLRGAADVVAGRYPPFVFGLGLGSSSVPLFRCADPTVESLEPALIYLAKNRYRSLPAAELKAVLEGRKTPPRAVVLTFDLATAALWRVGLPLLRRYGFRAITYAVPARTAEATAVRPGMEDDRDASVGTDHDDPLATWPELKAMIASGWLEVQSATWSHSAIFADGRLRDVVRPGALGSNALEWPRLNALDPPEFATEARLGYPLFATASRMSDTPRFVPDLDHTMRLEAFVKNEGGSGFFDRPTWRRELRPLLRNPAGRSETAAEQWTAIEYELVAARETLEARLGGSIAHVCLPWAVSGRVTTEVLRRVGVATAIADRWSGRYGLQAAGHAHYLKRLPASCIFSLPGRGRRLFGRGR